MQIFKKFPGEHALALKLLKNNSDGKNTLEKSDEKLMSPLAKNF